MSALLLQKAVWRARAMLAPRPRVLLYHRVTPTSTPDDFGMHVSPSDFGAHLELLRSRYRPMAMTAFLTAWQNGSLPRNAVVVTFDDGYADNLLEALPLLERHEVPATFFITTAYLTGRREFWWDALSRILEAGDEVVDEVGRTLGVALSPSGAVAMFPSCRDRLLAMPTERREELLQRWQQRAGLPDSCRDTHLVLGERQLAELASHALVEIGAHSDTHASLPHLSADAQLEEVVTSRRVLEECIGRRVRQFAYPFGAYDDVSESVVRSAGYDGAFTTEWAPVTPRTSRWRMPRLTISGSVDRLARALAHTA